MTPERRQATRGACAFAFEQTALDDALDRLDLLLTDLIQTAHTEGQKTRLRT